VRLSLGEREALNRHVAEIRRILKCQGFATMQLRININEHKVGSADYKLHETLTNAPHDEART
jgi:hypothetical protein